MGLRTRKTWRAVSLGPRGPNQGGLPAAARFRNALEELGGLYGEFARFLCWRADLLTTEYLGSLRQVRLRTPAIPQAQFARALSAELGKRGEALARGLESQPCWNTLSRCAYRTAYEGRAVVVQLARDSVPATAFAEFERGVQLLNEEGTRRAVDPEVLGQFRQWVRLGDSAGRERSYLEALSAVREKILAEYPVLIPELCSENVLSWNWVEGEPASAVLARASAGVVKIAECVLEQFSILGVVNGDLDLDAMVVTGAGRLAVRRADRLIAIPPAFMRATLQYLSAVLAGNSPVAVHYVLKLACGRSPLELESRLLDGLSSLEPELKLNLRFPQSAGIFESNMRALSRLGITKPLFLDSMHRNLVALGYWDAETTPRTASPPDSIAEAQWPVLGRLLRTRLGELVSREAVSDWAVGSTLLFFDSLRQMNRLADEFRDNDIALGVDTDGASDEDARRASRNISSGVIGGMLLIVFLVCLRWGTNVPAPWSAILAVIAAGAAIGLFWTMSRMG